MNLKIAALVVGLGTAVGALGCRSKGADQDSAACAAFRSAAAAGSSSNSAPSTTVPAPPKLASIVSVALPVTTDTDIRGTLNRPEHITIEKVFIAGVAATDDGSDFSSFDATIPFSTLVGLTTSAAPTTAQVVITAATNCDPDPLAIGTGTLTLALADKEITSLQLAIHSPSPASDAGYVPTQVIQPVELDLSANPNAAGAAVTIWTTLGTINGSASLMTTLAGDGVTAAGAKLFLDPDPMKQGTAVVVAQAVGAASSAVSNSVSVNMYGPPVLVPPTATLTAGQTIQVSVLDKGHLVGCNAGASPGVSVISGGSNLASGIVRLEPPDGAAPDGGVTAFQVTAGDAGAASTTVTCFDVYNQAGTGTFTVAKGN